MVYFSVITDHCLKSGEDEIISREGGGDSHCLMDFTLACGI